LLCWNCNQATGRHGFCPHEIERKGDSKWHSQAQPEQSEQG
jgi:hypothetical protein